MQTILGREPWHSWRVWVLCRRQHFTRKGGATWSSTSPKISPAFEVMSKRRKGFPSETQVKRGDRVVHGDKELVEKVGRNDPCPCGSGKLVKKCCRNTGCFRRRQSGLLLLGNKITIPLGSREPSGFSVRGASEGQAFPSLASFEVAISEYPEGVASFVAANDATPSGNAVKDFMRPNSMPLRFAARLRGWSVRCSACPRAVCLDGPGGPAPGSVASGRPNRSPPRPVGSQNAVASRPDAGTTWASEGVGGGDGRLPCTGRA